MAFDENLDAFFDVDDFAEEAVVTLSSGQKLKFKAILDTPTQSATIYDTEIETDAPFLRCKSESIVGVKRTNALVFCKTNYKVEKVVNDGTGVSMLYLKT
jgi:hypothetical protein